MRKVIEDMTALRASTMARVDSEVVRLFAQPTPPFLPFLPPPDSDSQAPYPALERRPVRA